MTKDRIAMNIPPSKVTVHNGMDSINPTNSYHSYHSYYLYFIVVAEW